MSLAEVAALAARNASSRGGRPAVMPAAFSRGGAGNATREQEQEVARPRPKSLVEIKAELSAKEAEEKKNAKKDWEGAHPWRPWDRDKDLDVRRANPKGKESILNNQHMGTLASRFGETGRRETNFM